ncbi:10519_t:CDS:2, partial [Entrophospora sp. SA101]
DEIWNYYNKGQEKNDGHYSATCYYCSKTWARGKPAKLKAHLANKCLPCPPDISKFWKDTLATEVVNYSRSKKNPTTPLPGIQPYITDHFGSKKPLPLFVTERIDHALLKAWIIAENRDVISNDEVLFLLQNEDFLTKCCHIHSVWGPIKECINILESNTATLADCFIYMIKLAVAIFKLPDSNQFKTSAIHIFNNRYIEFQHPAYLLCYYIHPLYREAALVAVKLWKNLNHSEQEKMDTPELWWGSIKNKPSHLSEIAIRLFGITPTQSNCGRNFSTLKWIIGDRRTRLAIQRLEYFKN